MHPPLKNRHGLWPWLVCWVTQLSNAVLGLDWTIALSSLGEYGFFHGTFCHDANYLNTHHLARHNQTRPHTGFFSIPNIYGMAHPHACWLIYTTAWLDVLQENCWGASISQDSLCVWPSPVENNLWYFGFLSWSDRLMEKSKWQMEERNTVLHLKCCIHRNTPVHYNKTDDYQACIVQKTVAALSTPWTRTPVERGSWELDYS